MVREGGLPCKRKEEKRKRNKERGIEKKKRSWTSDQMQQENKIREKTFEAAKIR